MKRIFVVIVAVLGAYIVVGCGKDTEKIIERVEVQKNALIHSGVGAPSKEVGNIGIIILIYLILIFMVLKQFKDGELLLV